MRHRTGLVFLLVALAWASHASGTMPWKSRDEGNLEHAKALITYATSLMTEKLKGDEESVKALEKVRDRILQDEQKRELRRIVGDIEQITDGKELSEDQLKKLKVQIRRDIQQADRDDVKRNIQTTRQLPWPFGSRKQSD